MMSACTDILNSPLATMSAMETAETLAQVLAVTPHQEARPVSA